MLIYAVANLFTLNNRGQVGSLDGDNAPAALVQGTSAKVFNRGLISITGSNVAGISILGNDAWVESPGIIRSDLTSQGTGDNNEGISLVGHNGFIDISGPFVSFGTNFEAAVPAAFETTKDCVARALLDHGFARRSWSTETVAEARATLPLASTASYATV